MKLYCPKCGRQIYADDMNLDTQAAKCHACHAVFGFNPVREGGDDAPLPPKTPPERTKVPLPKRIDVLEEGDDLVIRRGWYSAAFIALVIFCVFWDGMMIYACLAMFTDGGFPAAAWIVPVFLVTVGIALNYFAIAGFLNTTTIRIRAGRLTIQHGPLPWPGERALSTPTIQQLYCKQKIRQNREGRTRVTYELHVVLKDNRALKLLSGLPEMEQVLYIEQVMEQHLGIQDQRVPGELVHY